MLVPETDYQMVKTAVTCFYINVSVTFSVSAAGAAVQAKARNIHLLGGLHA